MLRIQSEDEGLVLGSLKDYLELLVYNNWEYYESEDRERLIDEIKRLRQVLEDNEYDIGADLRGRIDQVCNE